MDPHAQAPASRTRKTMCTNDIPNTTLNVDYSNVGNYGKTIINHPFGNGFSRIYKNADLGDGFHHIIPINY
jgi:hypothetical protein